MIAQTNGRNIVQKIDAQCSECCVSYHNEKRYRLRDTRLWRYKSKTELFVSNRTNNKSHLSDYEIWFWKFIPKVLPTK